MNPIPLRTAVIVATGKKCRYTREPITVPIVGYPSIETKIVQ